MDAFIDINSYSIREIEKIRDTILPRYRIVECAHLHPGQ